MKSLLKKIGMGVVILVFLLAVGTRFYLDGIIEKTIEGLGSSMLGAPVSVEKVNLKLLTGRGRIKGFHLGSPEGFKSDTVLEFAEISVSLKVGSLLSDTIIIESILIDEPKVTYEKSLTGSNFKKLLKTIEGDKEEPEDSVEDEEGMPAETEDSGKGVVIEDFLCRGGKMGLSSTLTQGVGLTLPLPEVHLTGIGQDEEEKTSLSDAFSLILKEILSSAMSAAGSSKEFLKGGAELGKDAVKGTADVAGKGLEKTKEGLKGLLGGDK